MRSSVLIAVLLSVASPARAEDPPRSIWLECQAPPVWPPRTSAPVRLTCRVEPSGPAYWKTVDPFGAERASELMDPFEDLRTIDVVDGQHQARPRPAPSPPRPAPSPPRSESADDLISPFEVYPDADDTLNPFDPPRQAGHPAR